uniref:hypothetical protein n=1 Tax=Celeribacter sp. TaxID=1890673 RepID=UPI003A901363
MSGVAHQMPRIGGTFSKPGQLVIQKFCLQKFALPLRTGEIPAICTKRSSGVSVHSRTLFTLRHFLASVEKAQLPIVEIPVDNNHRKIRSLDVVGV